MAEIEAMQKQAEGQKQAEAQAAPAKAARTLLVMGDSLSAAYGLSPAQGWVALTADRIGKHIAHSARSGIKKRLDMHRTG